MVKIPQQSSTHLNNLTKSIPYHMRLVNWRECISKCVDNEEIYLHNNIIYDQISFFSCLLYSNLLMAYLKGHNREFIHNLAHLWTNFSVGLSKFYQFVLIKNEWNQKIQVQVTEIQKYWTYVFEVSLLFNSYPKCIKELDSDCLKIIRNIYSMYNSSWVDL